MGNQASQKDKVSEERAEKEISVLKSASKLSVAEITQLYDKFKQDYPSGKLDKNEFIKLYKEIMGIGDRYDPFAERAFQVFDTNHNGSIEFSELVLACGVAGKGDIDAALELSFQLMDTSSDGLLSFQEFTKFLTIAKKLLDTDETAHSVSSFIIHDILKMVNVVPGHTLTKEQFIQKCKDSKIFNSLLGIQ